MFTIDASDNTINVTRGDILYFGAGAKDTESGEAYVFQPADIVRITVYGKKECENVLMHKDFLVESPTEEVIIFLDKEETKIGEVISKPTDYWYEIVINPETKPLTIIGYDADGAKVFRLYPEGADIPEEEIKPEDIPVVDKELDPLSTRPIENGAVARAFIEVLAEIERLKNEITYLKGESA